MIATVKNLSPVSDKLSDNELVQLALAGNNPAFELIMRRHNRLLFRTGRSILKNDDDTQDVLQEAYLSAWKALASYRADARLSTWLVRIVINEALGRLRRKSAQILPLNTAIDSEQESQEIQMPANADEEPEPILMRTQLRQQIEARIDTLPESFRTVFMLRGVEEMSTEEVAAALDIPEATVRSRFFRARGLLREGLSRDIDMTIGEAFSFAGTRCDSIVKNVLAKISHAQHSDLS